MRRVTVQERSLPVDKRVAFDPADGEDFDGLFKRKSREKEEALMLAVLADAVACFQSYAFSENESEKKSFQEAEKWVLDQNNDWLFSFDNICETLELDPDYVRQGLLRWREARRHDLRQQYVDKQKINVRRHARTSAADKNRWAKDPPLPGF
jgi:hypothetical protein